MVIAGKEMQVELDGKIYHCALDITMDYISGKWKTVILWYLGKEACRFSELNRLIPQITEKMLSLQLKQLEKDGIVSRTIYAEVPPRVEYALTDFGKTMLPMVEEIAAWGREVGRSRGKLIPAK